MAGNPPPLSENWHFRYASILLATPQLPTIQSILEGRNQVPPSHFRCRFTQIYVTVEKKKQLQLPFHGDFKCDGTQGCPKLARGLGQEGAGPPISPFTVAFQVGGVCSRSRLSPSVVPFQLPLGSLAIAFVTLHSFAIAFVQLGSFIFGFYIGHRVVAQHSTKTVYCSAEKPN